jgi:hypothetical protein
MILIGVPTRGEVHAGTCNDLIALISRSSVPLAINFAIGSVLPGQREHLAEQAMDMGASHLLFIDSDMRFPPDTLDRLLAHDKAIVASNGVTRKGFIRPYAGGFDGLPVYSNGKTGLEKVMTVGAGVLLIRRDVFEALDKPWFNFPYHPGIGHGGEDAWLCRFAAEKGIETWIDHDLTQDVKHIGVFEYGMEHAQPVPADTAVGA